MILASLFQLRTFYDSSLKSFESERQKLCASGQLPEIQCLQHTIQHFQSADCEINQIGFIITRKKKKASPEPVYMEVSLHFLEQTLSRVYHPLQRG